MTEIDKKTRRREEFKKRYADIAEKFKRLNLMPDLQLLEYKNRDLVNSILQRNETLMKFTGKLDDDLYLYIPVFSLIDLIKSFNENDLKDNLMEMSHFFRNVEKYGLSLVKRENNLINNQETRKKNNWRLGGRPSKVNAMISKVQELGERVSFKEQHTGLFGAYEDELVQLRYELIEFKGRVSKPTWNKFTLKLEELELMEFYTQLVENSQVIFDEVY